MGSGLWEWLVFLVLWTTIARESCFVSLCPRVSLDRIYYLHSGSIFQYFMFL